MLCLKPILITRRAENRGSFHPRFASLVILVAIDTSVTHVPRNHCINHSADKISFFSVLQDESEEKKKRKEATNDVELSRNIIREYILVITVQNFQFLSFILRCTNCFFFREFRRRIFGVFLVENMFEVFKVNALAILDDSIKQSKTKKSSAFLIDFSCFPFHTLHLILAEYILKGFFFLALIFQPGSGSVHIMHRLSDRGVN